jgi:hypothetical protein
VLRQFFGVPEDRERRALSSDDLDLSPTAALYAGPFERMAQLPELLGAARYATLAAAGAAMTAAQILDYAQQHTDARNDLA